MNMEENENLALDALMDLLDENESFSEEMPPLEDNTSKPCSDITVPKPIKTGALELTDMFAEKFLTPELVKNSKVDNTPDLSDLSVKYSAKTGEGCDSDDDSKSNLTETGKLILGELQKKPIDVPKRKILSASTWKMAASQNACQKKDEKLITVDRHSGIRIINPLVSFTLINQRMEGRRMIKMSFIQNFIKNGDIEGDWVTIGVLTLKTPPRTSQNGNAYSLWKMSDLNDTEKPITLFLFKGAHKEHWKITVGTVIGILNPSLMSDKDSSGNRDSGSIKLAVDHPGKLLLIGSSKDLGFCKSKKKDGMPCNVPVNKYQCEYCTYHVKNEYKKFSSKRSEIQAAYSGRELNLKDKILKGHNMFYGGQSFTSSPTVKKQSQSKSKDKLTLSNLCLKRKAEAIESEEKKTSVKKLADIYGPDILKVAEKNSEYMNNQLALPSAGSKNLIQHIIKDKVKKQEQTMKVISPKDLIKMRESQMSSMNRNKPKKCDASTLQSLMPQLGKGLSPGQTFDLSNPLPKLNRVFNYQDYAKMKAINKIKEIGPIKPKDPNSVKSSPESAAKVQAVLNKSFEEKEKNERTEPTVVHSKLGTLDLNSEKVKEILNRKSSHLYEVEIVEMEKEAAYFNNLEKKERMEEKMASTMETVVDVVSCLKCKYTAHSSAERCKQEGHPLKCHKAIKRFFKCKVCNKRCIAFTRLPSRPCRQCQSFEYERTAMMMPRKGPKLDSESLLIRGEEMKFID